jgi:hypothetical protein
LLCVGEFGRPHASRSAPTIYSGQGDQPRAFGFDSTPRSPDAALDRVIAESEAVPPP